MQNIDSQETLARFILSSKHFSRQNNIVKPQAFMPNPDRELSVFRVQSLLEGLEEQIWDIGRRYVSEPQNRTLYGRGDVVASVFITNGLTIIPDNDPPRHANIIDWPEDKSAQKLLAIKIAQKANLRIRAEN